MVITIMFGQKIWGYKLLNERKKCNIIGKKKVTPKEDDPTYDKWKAEYALFYDRKTSVSLCSM